MLLLHLLLVDVVCNFFLALLRRPEHRLEGVVCSGLLRGLPSSGMQGVLLVLLLRWSAGNTLIFENDNSYIVNIINIDGASSGVLGQYKVVPKDSNTK